MTKKSNPTIDRWYQETIDGLAEADRMSSSLAHSFTVGLAHKELDPDEWQRLQDGADELFQIAVNLTNRISLLKGREVPSIPAE